MRNPFSTVKETHMTTDNAKIIDRSEGLQKIAAWSSDKLASY